VISPGNDPSEVDWRNWILERRLDGAILVRVPSLRTDSAGERLPDAVFSFRDGDPQFTIWQQRLDERSSERQAS
jgi:hypothetical protein